MKNVIDFIKAKWWVGLAALLIVPYLAYENMKARKAKELAESTYAIDDRIDGLKISVNRDGVTITYQDGTQKPADAIGITAVTLDDHKQAPERLKAQDLKDDDFPVVAFFNHTGFDASGTPVMVRRARDGMQVFPKNGGTVKGYRLRAAVPLRSGGWTAYYWDGPDKTGKTVVSDEDWASVYLNAAEQKVPSPEELDRMTDEQLRAIGVQRMTKEEAKLRETKKNGVRGRIVKVGGNPAIVPLKVPIHIFKGKAAFDGVPKYDPKDARIAISTMSDEEGRYAIDLPPGEYTMTIEYEGRLWGNAIKDTYPSFKVPEAGWIEYDFRKGN